MKFLQILVLVLGLVIFVNAQKSALTGTVYDASGAVIPKAKLIAINEKGEKFETVTNDEGVYVLNLLFQSIDAKTSVDFKVAKYEIIVDLENRGFEKFILKDFKFVPSFKGKMNLDIALDSINPEPCGYSGVDCPTVLYCPAGEQETIQTTEAKISDKIQQKPLEKSPKIQNKIKRKNKNNK